MRKIHFIGIGGIGMSALASICLSKGDIVTGSDLRPNNLTDELCRRGAIVHKGHSAGHIPKDADLVVRSTCIRDDNPEIKSARELKMPVHSRGEMLKQVMEGFPLSVAVTGTHGKTTTSALVAHIAEHCGEDPTVVVGGEIEKFKGNAKFGRGDMIVAEVDESDGYFRNIGATCAIITNVEKEHMEHYGCLENLTAAYREFISRISEDGCCVFNGEDPLLGGLLGASAARKVSFGVDGDFDVTCRGHVCARSIEFDLVLNGKDHGKVYSSLTGRYNLMNILGAITMCVETGLDPSRVIESIGSFRGVRRRFDLAGKVGNIEVIEDYAHHPTELRSVIAAARDYSPGRVVTIFQPHRYSRTRDLMREFSNCFYGSNVLILTEIYSADEEKIEGVGVKGLYEKIDKSRFERLELLEKNDIPAFMPGIVREGDVILVLGAGDIRDIAEALVESIARERRKSA